MIIREAGNFKLLKSDGYNFIFNRTTGLFVRWGNDLADNPSTSPYGPEILDMEISSGQCKGNCKFCYKGNGSRLPANNMSFETFTEIFDSLPKTLTQIAFGITDVNTNPDFWKIMNYTRFNGVIPNYTTNGFDVTKEVAEFTSKVCGAVAVSLYNKDICYDAVKMFTDEGMKQVNIHFMLAEETIDEVEGIMQDIINDDRLSELNAIVFLQYKPKGSGIGEFHSIGNIDKLQNLINYANFNGIRIGFDSCSAPVYFKAVEHAKNYDTITKYVEPCESGLFSFYCNVDGEYFPCSFSEGEIGWEEGIKATGITDFREQVWEHPRVEDWRQKLISSSSDCDCKSMSQCRSCPLFRSVTACKQNDILKLGMM